MMNYEVMGMKQIYNIMVGMALMLGATSCEKEILDNGQAAGIALADGQFIVDYSGEVTTRAIKDNAEKGERINSLTYLLYIQQENDYVLQKRREIPGLNKKDDVGNPVYESWPLTRDNMTWEQREALKDTLMVGSNYRAVFVANAAPSLWGETNDDDMTKSPLKEADEIDVDTYSSAYLQLPEDLAFNDGNMFYLAEAEINGAGKDRNTPYNCSITLKRVVTRTDWWFERLPEFTVDSENPNDWKAGEEVKAYSTAMLNSVLAESWNFILESINEETTSFLDAMIGYFEAKGKDPNNEGTLTSPYDSYVAALTTMKEGLSASNYVSNLLSANNGLLSADLFEELRVACLSNTEIQEAWKASWRKDECSARLIYSSSAEGADKLYLDRRAEGTKTESSLMSIDSQEENTLDGYTYDGFHFVGLANPELNQVSQVIISDANNTETTINVSATVHTGQGINERYGVYYRPIAELGLKDNWNNSGTTEAIISKKITCNLATALPFAEDGSQEELKNAMADATATGLQGYGTSLNSIPLTINLPNLANTAVLKITDSWNMRKID